MHLKHSIPILLSLFLLNCAHVPHVAARKCPKAYQQKILRQQFDNWSMVGQVILQQEQKKSRVHVYWQKQGPIQHISLSGPMGIGNTDIDIYPEFSQLEQVNGRIYQGKTPEIVMQKVLGWSLPLSVFKYWITGLNSHGAQNQQSLLQHDHKGPW